MARATRVAVALLLVALAPSAAGMHPAGPRDGDEVPDEIVLAGGKTISGRIVFESADEVAILVRNKVKSYARDEIDSMRSASQALAALLKALIEVAPADLEARLDLARVAREAGLHGEAELLLLGIVVQQPDHDAANTLLGHRNRRDVWQRKHGSKWVDTDDLATHVEDWGDRWVLSTRHYELRTNLPLPAAIDAAWDLERLLAAYQGLLGAELELHDVTEEMFVQVHADTASYPQPTGGRSGYYEPGSRTLYVDATLGAEGRAGSLGAANRVLAHEGTHQLLHMTTQRTTKAKGLVPAWLDEGLAVYFESARVGRDGTALFLLGEPSLQHLRAHALAEKPYDLNRILTMDTGDFLASAHVAQKYGQAYSLVHFSLHGDDAAHRPGFFGYLKRAWEGKSSMTEFKRNLALKPDDFEERWHLHAKRLGRG